LDFSEQRSSFFGRKVILDPFEISPQLSGRLAGISFGVRGYFSNPQNCFL
jgi:hypothetical protein